LPALAAALILCVPSLQGRHLDPRASTRLSLGAAVLFLIMATSGFAWHLWRYAYGVRKTIPRFDPMPLPRPVADWLPPIGQPLTFGLLILGTSFLVFLLLRGSGSQPREADIAEELVNTDHSSRGGLLR
jgi:hypothetical protein